MNKLFYFSVCQLDFLISARIALSHGKILDCACNYELKEIEPILSLVSNRKESKQIQFWISNMHFNRNQYWIFCLNIITYKNMSTVGYSAIPYWSVPRTLVYSRDRVQWWAMEYSEVQWLCAETIITSHLIWHIYLPSVTKQYI